MYWSIPGKIKGREESQYCIARGESRFSQAFTSEESSQGEVEPFLRQVLHLVRVRHACVRLVVFKEESGYAQDRKQ